MWARISGTLVLVLLSCNAAAIDQIQLHWRTIESAGWQLSDVNLVIDWMDSGQSEMTLEVASLQMGDYQLEKLRFSCSKFELLPAEINCRQGQLSLSSDWFDAEAVPAAINYQFDSRDLTVSVPALPLAGGQVHLAFHWLDSKWELTARLTDTMLAGIADLLATSGLEIPQFDYQGSVSGKLSTHGDSRGLKNVVWKTQTQESGYSNAQGTQAAEALVLVSTGSASPQDSGWRVKATLAARQGMLYAEPVYLEFSELRPLELTADLHWDAGNGELLLRSMAFRQPDVVTGSVDAVWAPGAETPLRQLGLELDQAWLPGLFDTWLQPWLAGSVLEKLETAGRLQGRLKLLDGRPQSMQMKLDQVSFREPNGQFGVRALNGELSWDNSGAVHQSRLAWRGANFYQLQLGAAELGVESDESSVKIQQPLVVSLLDGELHVDEFELGIDHGELHWLLDGMLTPVSMQAFSAALGWPPLSGKLSGMVPKVRYEKGELTLGGVLLVQAFDGDITLRNLRIQQPLGLVPRLWADARLERIDLKTLSRTFSFGRIEGRLQGRVNDLYMEAWQLVAFDAAFQTPPDDRSRHRISQKAVDNISNLGGAGVGGAVSRSFLRFLEDFPYRRLGIRCRLENGICHMDGVAPAENGYYLVQGGLLPPRLDVIAYASEVDWLSLLGRLKSISAGNSPVVR
ncbi:MAG: hypothetical protein U9P00_01770, partial [Pseudomonadota bacterium]|nr:hypothetical protein [Pseudomonadota bacterium]